VKQKMREGGQAKLKKTDDKSLNLERCRRICEAWKGNASSMAAKRTVTLKKENKKKRTCECARGEGRPENSLREKVNTF